jgi:sarcosine oxidase subunit delta
MLLIACPYCGARPESSSAAAGSASRPPQPSKVDTRAERIILYRTNPKGVHAERWLHAHGCQRWFNMLRDTTSDQVIGIYAMGESRPDRPKT